MDLIESAIGDLGIGTSVLLELLCLLFILTTALNNTYKLLLTECEPPFWWYFSVFKRIEVLVLRYFKNIIKNIQKKSK